MLTNFLYKILKFNSKKIFYKKKILDVYLADSIFKQMLGLMHRASLGKKDGMLFTFGREGKYDIWMLNMKFSIDILWLSGEGKILKIVEKAVPCKSVFSCQLYSSPNNAAYVIELNSGKARKERMKIGDRFTGLS